MTLASLKMRRRLSRRTDKIGYDRIEKNKAAFLGEEPPFPFRCFKTAGVISAYCFLRFLQIRFQPFLETFFQSDQIAHKRGNFLVVVFGAFSVRSL